VRSPACSPFDVSTRIKSVRIQIGNHEKLSYQGKMRCKLTPPRSATFEIRGTLVFPARPPTLKISDISLVLKT
jgi:hypothetical protein